MEKMAKKSICFSKDERLGESPRAFKGEEFLRKKLLGLRKELDHLLQSLDMENADLLGALDKRGVGSKCLDCRGFGMSEAQSGRPILSNSSGPFVLLKGKEKAFVLGEREERSCGLGPGSAEAKEAGPGGLGLPFAHNPFRLGRVLLTRAPSMMPRITPSLLWRGGSRVVTTTPRRRWWSLLHCRLWWWGRFLVTCWHLI